LTASIFHSIKEDRIMNKATSALVAAVAALALSGGAYAQQGGGTSGGSSGGNGSSHGSTSAPATNQMQMNDSTGYGTPGTTNSDTGMGANSQNGPNNSSTPPAAPKSNNTLATPSVKSPGAQ
jgi:hypothetical protein